VRRCCAHELVGRPLLLAVHIVKYWVNTVEQDMAIALDIGCEVSVNPAAKSNTELAFLLHDAGLNYGTEQVADGHKGIVRFQSAATLPANHVGKTEMAG